MAKATGYETDLYTINGAGPLFPRGKPDVIEKDVLGPIDSNGAKALRALIDGPPSQLSPEQQEFWATFVNSLLERHPQRIYGRDRIAEKLARERLDAIRQKFAPPPPGRPDVFEMVAPHIESLARDMHRRHIANEMTNPRSIGYLKSLEFTKFTLDAESPLRFVTADNPVLVNGGQPWPIDFLSIALGPRDLLFAWNNREPLTDDETIRGLALIHNLQLFLQAEYVFSQGPLVDLEGVRMRYAAQISLKQVPWRKS